jgi:hypothetical protein
MRCPKCRNRVLQKSGSQTRVRIQGAVLFDEEGLCKSQCYWCKEPITVPLKIAQGTSIQSERFVIKR